MNKLSIYLLKEIIEYLDEDIDKICLVMTCKRLWMLRDKLLWFNYQAPLNLQSFKECYSGIDEDRENGPSEIINVGYKDPYRYCIDGPSYATISFGESLKKGIIPNHKNYVILDINEVLEEGSIPSNVRTLEFGSPFRQSVPPGVLVGGKLKRVQFSSDYRTPLQIGSIPNGVKELILGEYSKPLDSRILPESLESLKTGFKSVENMDWSTIPNSLVFLGLTGFRDENDEEDSHLFGLSKAEQIECLEFDMVDVDRKLVLTNETVPPNLRYLSLLGYTKTIKSLPTNLTCLELTGFQKEIGSGVLPVSLETLSLGIYMHKFNEGVLPAHLESLTIKQYNQPFPIGSLPPSLTSLTINKFYGVFTPGALPNSLLNLSFGKYGHPINEGDIPDSITNLTIGLANESQVNSLPNNLETLSIIKIGNKYKYPTTQYLLPIIQLCPPTLKSLYMGCLDYDQLVSLCPIGSFETLLFYYKGRVLALRPFLGNLKKVITYYNCYSFQIRQLSPTSYLVLMDKPSLENGGIVSIDPDNPNDPLNLIKIK